MGLENVPQREGSTIYNNEGATSVPKEIRENDSLEITKGDNLVWVKHSDEDYVRVYKHEDIEDAGA